MNIAAKIVLAIAIGIAVGIVTALAAAYLNLGGEGGVPIAAIGGAAGGISAGLIATTLRGK